MQNQFPKFVTTDEFARALGRCSQTIRKNLCLTGEAYGIRPNKIGGRLLWPSAEIERLLRGDTTTDANV